MNPDRKWAIVWFDRMDVPLKLSSPVLTAKHFILKTSKYNPACVSLIVVPADSPSLSPPLLRVIFSCPQDPPCARLSFSPPPLPHSLLFGSAAALEDAWHHGTVCTQEDDAKGKRVQRRAERRMSEEKGTRRLDKTIASFRFSPWVLLVHGRTRRFTWKWLAGRFSTSVDVPFRQRQACHQVIFYRCQMEKRNFHSVGKPMRQCLPS